jgi:hypothetical protein
MKAHAKGRVHGKAPEGRVQETSCERACACISRAMPTYQSAWQRAMGALSKVLVSLLDARLGRRPSPGPTLSLSF